jgi:hypothetical protein
MNYWKSTTNCASGATPDPSDLTLFVFFTVDLINRVAAILPEIAAPLDFVGLLDSGGPTGLVIVALKPATYTFPASDVIETDGATLSYVAPHYAGAFTYGPDTLKNLLPLFPGSTPATLVETAECLTHAQFAQLVDLLLSLNDQPGDDDFDLNHE